MASIFSMPLESSMSTNCPLASALRLANCVLACPRSRACTDAITWDVHICPNAMHTESAKHAAVENTTIAVCNQKVVCAPECVLPLNKPMPQNVATMPLPVNMPSMAPKQKERCNASDLRISSRHDTKGLHKHRAHRVGHEYCE